MADPSRSHFFPLSRDAKECGKNVSIELFEEGYPEEAREPTSHVKGSSSRVNLPSYMIEVKRKI